MIKLRGIYRPSSSARRIGLAYLVFGALWILFSGHAAELVSPDEKTLATIEAYKGLAFVAFSAVLVVVLVNRSDQRRRRNRRALSSVVAQLGDVALLMCPRHGRILEVNGDLRALLGIDPDTVLGNGMTALGLNTVEGERFLSDTAKHLKEHDEYVTVVTMHGPTGKPFDCQWVITIDEQGQLFAVLSNLNRRSHDEAFRRRLLDIFERTPEYVAVLSPELTVKYLNPALRALVGQQQRSAPRPSVFDGIARDFHAVLRLAALPEAEQTGMWQGELGLLNGRGRTVPVLCSLLAHRDREGHIESFSCLARDITQIKRQEQESAQQRREMEFLSADLLEARESERKQVALELHDEFGALLSTLRLDLDWVGKQIDDPRVGARIEEMRDLLLRGAQQLRALCAQLRPPMLDDLGLRAASEWLIESMQKRCSARFEICQCDDGLEEMPDKVQITAYRIIQEALTNAIKHGNADNVWLWIEHQGEQLQVTIADDGCGLSTEDFHKPGHIGLSGMRERVRILSGELRFASTLEGGTMVVAEIPAKQHRQPRREGP